jgi:hypothetical protein
MGDHATILPPPPSRALALRAAITARYVRFKTEAARRWRAAGAILRAFARGDAHDEPGEQEGANAEYVTVRLSSLGTQRPVRFMDEPAPPKAEQDERPTVVDKPR